MGQAATARAARLRVVAEENSQCRRRRSERERPRSRARSRSRNETRAPNLPPVEAAARGPRTRTRSAEARRRRLREQRRSVPAALLTVGGLKSAAGARRPTVPRAVPRPERASDSDRERRGWRPRPPHQVGQRRPRAGRARSPRLRESTAINKRALFVLIMSRGLCARPAAGSPLRASIFRPRL